MARTGRNSSDPNYQVVPTNDLAAVLKPLIRSLNHELANGAADQWNNPNKGAVEVVADRTHEALETEQRSVPRRLWSILARECFTLDIGIAETILLLGFDVNIEDTDIPTFPGNVAAAREMVKCRVTEKLTRADKDALAISLLHFSEAYLQESADPETIERTEAAKEKRRQRKATAIETVLAEAREELVAA